MAEVVTAEVIAKPKIKLEEQLSRALAAPVAQFGLACANGFGAYTCFRAGEKAGEEEKPLYYVVGSVLAIFAGYHFYKTVSPRKFVY